VWPRSMRWEEWLGKRWVEQESMGGECSVKVAVDSLNQRPGI
jgi:hypothetical protein